MNTLGSTGIPKLRGAMPRSIKPSVQALLKKMGVYHRLKSSGAYDLYWRIADRRLIRDRARVIEFYRHTLEGFHKGELVFDIGAHQGQMTEVFLRLGARVVAVEPDVLNQQVLDQTFLRLRLRKRPVTIVGKAISDRNGAETLWTDEPGSAMNTLNHKWVETLRADATRFGDTLQFGVTRQVETMTLDELIRVHGVPFYIKVDVEGHEPSVLKGLRSVVPFVSFEVNLPEFRPEGQQCIALLGQLADGTFNYTVDCRQGMALPQWSGEKAFTTAFNRCTASSIEVFWRAPLPEHPSSAS